MKWNLSGLALKPLSVNHSSKDFESLVRFNITESLSFSHEKGELSSA